MGLNETASAERVHIGFFGMRNAGKSSVVNAVTGQNVSLVSDFKGTTTDPVKKAMEILPLGPVVVIDTPGMDDEGELGALRVLRAKRVLSYADLAVLVVDATKGLMPPDKELISAFKEKEICYVVAYNKSDLLENVPKAGENEIYISAATKDGIDVLRQMLGKLVKRDNGEKRLVSDLISPSDMVVLVTPIDASAPKGRLILPQQQTIRDILDVNAVAIVTQETELKAVLSRLCEPPKMVITDSQAFGRVSACVPKSIPLTSFSILFARYKGDLCALVHGASALDKLNDGDTVLISEGCTHHRQCGDIGSVKLPAWIKKHSGKELKFEFTSGMDFSEDISKYALIIHCGGCMLNEREMKSRIRYAADQQIPITNYGVAIAHIHGILRRSLELFPDVLSLLD